jgi:hypothetical protein
VNGGLKMYMGGIALCVLYVLCWSAVPFKQRHTEVTAPDLVLQAV